MKLTKADWQRARRTGDVTEAMRALDPKSLLFAISQVLLERSAPDAPAGLDDAAHIAICGLLGIELDGRHAPKIERLAAVARGARLAPDNSNAVLLRELATLIDYRTRWGLGVRSDALALSRSLEKWRPERARRLAPTIDSAAVESALSKPSEARRVADVAVAIGLIADRQSAFNAARDALRNRASEVRTRRK